jgi:uncharacterized protein
MPEYLTPGVYVEETSFRSKSIEGVPTSTFGMAGVTRYGPVSYVLDPGPNATNVLMTPSLVTSYTEFERAFGDLREVQNERNYLAHAARAFFGNGGRRLYVSRVFSFPADAAAMDACFARRVVGDPEVAQWRARWPGLAGREIQITTALRRGKNIIRTAQGQPPALVGVREDSLIEVLPEGTTPPEVPDAATLFVVRRSPDDVLGFDDGQGGVTPVAAGTAGYQIQVDVTVTVPGMRSDTYSELAIPRNHPRSVFRVLEAVDPADEVSLVFLRPAIPAAGQPEPAPGQILAALLAPASQGFLTGPTPAGAIGGSDGTDLTPAALLGEQASPDSITDPATGLEALGEVEDIAIVATPDTARFEEDERKTAVDNLIRHCERLRYRMAIVDPPEESSISEVREFRSTFDTKYAALYYPWLEIVDPYTPADPGSPAPRLLLPPSGAVAGIYARNDIERGVHKAPANEVVLGITRFERNVNYDQQAVLNPDGINALRFFEGRSNRVWGARTMSSDPEWKYVNVRRLFIYLEHSIDRSTQWAVFEPNNERLWASIRQTIEDFLLVTWRTGALMGARPEEAFFVRCDRSTMTQNDLDNGRLICLIGVAPTYPAEFVIFRIGQWTADARRT